MQLVRQKEESAARRKNQTRAVVAVLTVTAIASGCASAGGSDAVKPAHGQQPLKAPPARALDSYAHQLAVTQAARVAAAKRWRLAKTPLAAPAPPRKKPRLKTRKGFEVKGQAKLPPVFTTIPTKQKVVFLTIDDGAEKDPALLRMMSDLRIPYTAFLSDYLVKEDYAYFKKMQSRGVTLNNHTLNHRYMPGLSYKSQRREICGMQDTIEKRYGKRPELFRPPYGNYNDDTLRAAKSCGIKAVPLWNAEVFADRMEYREWDRDLHPGDIILTHFRGREDWKGTMPDMVRRLMKTVTGKGYAVARLEDYL
ncbi:polysaccharide deacetylase family protein [Streptomyces alboniger]|uniref:Polysaccharide deacetylase family protein n=1 Tax=Streptomyces alboniger TaxID=132473 RepID=A0A5J6I0N2_STRAD|nr:polysaccharide deacetylase family protein [Streptomyces alboniger]QEV22465.1 polysaccharide deacetylase family protein [Streptomyces alboniger]